jgi:hypothetical protein
MTEVAVLELTWYVPPSRVPQDPSELLEFVKERYSPAFPTRFGLGDPPPIKWDADGGERFAAEWKGRLSAGYFMSWRGRKPFLDGSFLFPDHRGEGEDGLPAGMMQWLLDADAAELDPEPIVDLFVGLARFFPSIYGCAYLLRGWSVLRGQLLMDAFVSDRSPLPGSSRWLGIPPGQPWLTWLGQPYDALVGNLSPSIAEPRDGGILARRARKPTHESDQAPTLHVPSELRARRADPRSSNPPDVAADVMPLLPGSAS